MTVRSHPVWRPPQPPGPPETTRGDAVRTLDDFTVNLAQANGCRVVAAFGPPGAVVDLAQRRPEGGLWSALARGEGTPRSPPDPERTLVICQLDADDPAAPQRLDAVRRAVERAPVAIVLLEPSGGAAEPTCRDLQRTLESAALHPAFVGRVRAPASGRPAALAVLHLSDTPSPPTSRAPDDFRVLAIVPTFNEEDIIAQTLRYLVAEGVEVHLLDNGSTDATVERARPFLGRGLVAIERFPPEGAARTYDLQAILTRVEEVAELQRGASWVMLHDADERRRSPWPGVHLREALWHVERCGFTCVDHVTLNFPPTDDAFDPEGADLEQHFEHFEFSAHPGHFHQRRVWKQLGRRVLLWPSAGHDVAFEGRRVYPYRFLLKHYPIRSQAHGERKVLRERRERWNARERELGWHRQYNELADTFVRDSATLTRFVPETFGEEFLLERLSGAGVFAEPPSWATPPRW